MSVNRQQSGNNRHCVSMYQAMNRLASWLWTISPFTGRNSDSKKMKKTRMKRGRANTDSRLFDDTSDDSCTTTQPGIHSPLITNSSREVQNSVCMAAIHQLCPEYECEGIGRTETKTEIHQNVEAQRDCDEVDGHPSSFPQPLRSDLQQGSESLTMYFDPKQLNPTSKLTKNRTLKKKANCAKNIVDQMPGNHRFSDELKNAGHSSLLCPVHHQTNEHKIEKRPACGSSSCQSIGISCDKPTSVIKDPLALVRQGSEYFECETETIDKCDTENSEESCPGDVLFSKKMSITERRSEIICAHNEISNESISDKNKQSQSHTVMHGNESYLVGDTSIITANSHEFERDNHLDTYRETSMVKSDESDSIHLSSIGSATGINQQYLQRPLSRTGSLSSIDSVTYVSCDSCSPEFINDVQDGLQDSGNDEASIPDDRGQKNSDSLEGLWLKLPASDTDALPNNTTGTNNEDCDETDSPSFTVVEGAEIHNDEDNILVSEDNAPIVPHASELRANSSEDDKSKDARKEKQQIPKVQKLEVGYDTDNTKSYEDVIVAPEASIPNEQVTSETKANTCENSKSEEGIQDEEIPKAQSRDSGYDTDNTKSKSKGSSRENRMTDVEKRRNALMKRLAERTIASLAPYCSSGMYTKPKANDNKKSASKGNENSLKADLTMDRKAKQVPDPKSPPHRDQPVQKSPQCRDSDTAIILTSANDGQWTKSVVQDTLQGLDTASNEELLEVFDEDLYGDDLNVGEPDGMDEYFAAVSLREPNAATAVSKTDADGEGYDETDNFSEPGDIEVHRDNEHVRTLELGEPHAPEVVEIQNLGSESESSSTGTHLCSDFTSMRSPSLPTKQPIAGSAYANPYYKTKKRRFHSFGGKIWRLSSPSVEEIVYCGFHYLGPGDKTQCFSCGIILMEWEISDVPVEEHLRHSPNCSFSISVASLHKQWLSPFIEGAIDIVKAFNEFENATIERAIEQLDVKDVHVFTAPQLLDEVYHIEEEKEREELSILYMYGIEGATCQDITDEILHKELLHKLAPPDAGTTGDNQVVFEPIENVGLGADVDDLGAGFNSFLNIPAVKVDEVNSPMVTHEDDDGEVEEEYFSIHPEMEHGSNVADKPGEGPGASDSEQLDVRHDSGCISGGGSPLLAHDPAIVFVSEEAHSEDDASSLYDTDYYSEEESLDDLDQVDLTPAPEPLLITEEQKAEIEARRTSLRQRNEELRLWSACKVCLVKSVTQLYIDCGHLAVCSSCSSQLQACPICRKRITNSMTVYMH